MLLIKSDGNIITPDITNPPDIQVTNRPGIQLTQAISNDFIPIGGSDFFLNFCSFFPI